MTYKTQNFINKKKFVDIFLFLMNFVKFDWKFSCQNTQNGIKRPEKGFRKKMIEISISNILLICKIKKPVDWE